MNNVDEQLPERWDLMPLAPPPSSAGSEVDVIITTRNDALRLCTLVNRLPGQDIHNLFIVDDGTTDVDAAGVLDRLEAGGHHVVRQDHRGLSRARNEGARVSSAPFLLYLEVGTVPLAGYLPEATTRMNDDSAVAAVLADGRSQDDGAPIVVCEPDLPSMVATVPFGPFAVLRRAAIEKAGGWDERLESGQDRDLFFTLLETGWSFAKLRSTGFTRFVDASESVPSTRRPVTRADGMRIAEKHHELVTTHLPAVIGAYESALAEFDNAPPAGIGSSGNEGSVHDLMDQLAAVRSDLASSEADGVRARSIVADVDAARLEAERRAEDAQAVFQERISILDREIGAIYASKSFRLLRIPRRIYALARTRLR